jgi:hypothetical protein
MRAGYRGLREALAIVAVLVSVHLASAQSYTGGLRGAVRDQQGVVPGAEILLINEETNVRRNTVSNDTGEYTLANLVPGLYRLSVAMPGFARYEQAGLRLATQQVIVVDVTLLPSGVTEEVKVSATAGVLETGSASVSSLIDRRALETTPSPGRNPFFLAVTTPNVVPSGDPQFVRQQDQTNASLLSLAGGPRRGNNYTLEGVPITDMRNRAVLIPSIEALEEVKVQVSTYDAEMGRTGGGVFNTVGKSGSNAWHGSGLIQNRPEWGQGKLFFAQKQGLEKPESYFWLYGGSFGGPVIKNRTFFWASTEGYKTLTSRNAVLTLPTQAERNGDFSQSGITIYDPLTTRADPNNPGQFIRTPFANNIIPADRLNPVAKSALQYLPLPASGKSLAAVAQLIDRANQLTTKVDHRWSDKFSTSGMYAWYDSTEPESRFYGGTLGENPGDPGEGALYRTVHVLTLNNTWVPSNSTVVALRYGYTQFQDNNVPNGFDAGTLGFAQNYLSAITYNKFPVMNIDGYGRSASVFGDRSPTDLTWYSQGANASLSHLWGRHTLKLGGDFRRIGAQSFSRGQPAGSFSFTKNFTQGPNPNIAGTTAGDAFASYLLGYPASGSITVGTPADFYVNYFAGYAQDDFRVSSKLTVNAGLRYEYETGLSEQSDALTVGFDRTRAFPVQVAGMNLTGGLMYAGVDGYNTYQGEPSNKQLAPRVGVTYLLTDTTVLHGGYGLFWAPTQYPSPSETSFGTRGFTAVTSYFASNDGLIPAGTLTNPFPNGIEQPQGSSGGLLTGAGGDVHFIDQFSKPAYVQQFSIDLQRELPGRVSVSAGYVGSRSDRLAVGGTADSTLNINQIPTQYLSMGTALQELVPNPFYGNAAFGALGRSTTIARGQLLRPYPQFLGVFAHRVSEAKARYHSMVLKADKRIADGWGLRVNYTYSVMKDNQYGETNFFANRGGILNNYDIDAEYGPSMLDTPHRLNIVANYDLPFGEGKRWVRGGGLLQALVGGWTVTGVGSYQSGFPIGISQSNNNSGLLGSGQRPNLVSGVDPGTSGSDEDRVGAWFNSAAWVAASPFTLGNAPRTDTRVRTPFKKNWDIAIQKTQRLSAGMNLMLRAEIINAFNNPNFLGPATAFGLSSFGQVTEVGGFPRMLQVMARLSF